MSSSNIRVAAVIVKNGRILLIKRIKSGETYYVLPGGHPEKDESPEDTLGRELSEETTLDIKVDKLLYKLENPSTKSQEMYYLCSTDDEYLELDKASKEYHETIEGKNIYVPMWVDLDTIPKLNFFPLEIRDLIIRQNFPSRFYKYTQDKYIHQLENSVSTPHHLKIINKALDDLVKLFTLTSKYIFGFFTMTCFSLMVLSFYGEIRIDPPTKGIYIGTGSGIKLISGTFWPTVIYITRNSDVIELLPKELVFNAEENTYFSKTSTFWKSYKLDDGTSKYTYRGGVYKWIPVVFFGIITSLFFYLTFNKARGETRMNDE